MIISGAQQTHRPDGYPLHRIQPTNRTPILLSSVDEENYRRVWRTGDDRLPPTPERNSNDYFDTTRHADFRAHHLAEMGPNWHRGGTEGGVVRRDEYGSSLLTDYGCEQERLMVIESHSSAYCLGVALKWADYYRGLFKARPLRQPEETAVAELGVDFLVVEIVGGHPLPVGAVIQCLKPPTLKGRMPKAVIAAHCNRMNPVAVVDCYKVVHLPHTMDAMAMVVHGAQAHCRLDHLEVRLLRSDVDAHLPHVFQRVYGQQMMGVRGLFDLRLLEGVVQVELVRVRPELLSHRGARRLLPQATLPAGEHVAVIGRGPHCHVDWVAVSDQLLAQRQRVSLGDIHCLNTVHTDMIDLTEDVGKESNAEPNPADPSNNPTDVEPQPEAEQKEDGKHDNEDAED